MRNEAQALLGRARDGRGPSRKRALARGLPIVGEAVEAWLGTRNARDASLAPLDDAQEYLAAIDALIDDPARVDYLTSNAFERVGAH